MSRSIIGMFVAVLSLFFSFASLLPVSHDEVTFSLTAEKNDLSKVGRYISDPFVARNITFSADIAFCFEEFFYLVALTSGDVVTVDKIKKALFYLFEKKKFQRITVIITQQEDGKTVHFSLESFVTFDRLIVRGFLPSKDQYKQYYSLHVGDQFVHRKHIASLEKIRQALSDAGYCNAYVTSKLLYNKKNKTVTVHLFIKRKQRFVIDHISHSIDTDHFAIDDFAALSTDIQRYFIAPLQGNFYEETLIQSVVTSLKEALMRRGYLDAVCQVTKHIVHALGLVRLMCIVRLNKKRKFVFVGNHFFSDATLLKKILDLKDATLFLPSLFLSRSISSFYRDHGFYHVNVQVEESENQCSFFIKEGEQICIKEVKIIERDVQTKICDQATFYLNQENRQLALREKIDFLKEKAIAWYQDRGFCDAYTGKLFLQRHKDTRFTLCIPLFAGKPYYLEQVTVWFPQKDAYVSLQDVFPPTFFVNNDQEVPFTKKMVASCRKQVQALLATHATHQYVLSPVITKKEQRVRLQWNVTFTHSQKGYFGKCVVRGVSPIPFKIVSDFDHKKKGNTCNFQANQELVQYLKSLHIFESVSLLTGPNCFDTQEYPVHLLLRSDDPFEIRLNAGIGLLKNIQGDLRHFVSYYTGSSFLIKNPFSYGDLCSFSFDKQRLFHRFCLEYKNPSYFRYRIGFSSRVYHAKDYRHRCNIFRDTFYYTSEYGGAVEIGYKGHAWKCACDIGLSGVQAGLSFSEHALYQTYYQKWAEAVHFTSQPFDRRFYRLFFIPYCCFEFDSLDRLQCHFSADISGKIILPFHSNKVHSAFMRLRYEHVATLKWGRLLCAARLCTGYIFGANLCRIPPVERFYLGGAYSMRGYQTDFVPPLTCIVKKEGKKVVLPCGGKKLFNANFELQWQLCRNIFSVLFHDVGYLGADLVQATGCGLRYKTPIGSIRFDVAWRWKRHPLLNSQIQWFIALGNIF